MTAASVNGRFTSDVRAAARALVARGIVPVPVRFPTKLPNLMDGWEQLRLDGLDLDTLFPPGEKRNVGMLNGAPSGGRVDVDLDCREARAAAPLLLPPTGMVWGRKSTPDAHRCYRVDDPPRKAKDAYLDPTAPGTGKKSGALLLELRGTGGQTVLPPSIAPAEPDEGKVEEPVVWHTDGEPSEVTTPDLRAAVGAVAAAALLGRHLGDGNRHDPALSLAGGLLRAGWSEEKVETFVLAVAAASGGGDPKNLTQAVRDTAEKLKAGDEKVSGWPTLTKLLGPHGDAVVRQVREWLNITGGPRIVFGGKQSSAAPRYVPIPAFTPFPTDALPAPWSELVREGARSVGCDESYLGVPALAVAAAAVGNSRKVYLGRNWSEPAVVWGCIIGDSSTLKSPALALVTDPIRDRQQVLVEEYQIARKQYEQDVAQWTEEKKAHGRKEGDDPGEKPEEPTLKRLYCSDVTIERLADLLHDNPRGLLVVRDEAAGWLGSFGRYKSKGAGSDLPHWLEMFRAGAVTVDRKTSERKFTFVPRAAVSVVGGIQPHILTALLTPGFMACGLTARLLFTMPPSRPKVWTEDRVSDEVLAAVEKNLDALYALELETDDKGRPRPVAVGLSTAAKREWVSFYDSWGKRQAAAEGEVAAAFGKIEAYAARFALIHHVSTRAEDLGDTDSIGLDSIRAGVALARWFAAEAERVYRMLGESAEERDVRRLVEQVRRHGGRMNARALARSNNRRYRDSAAAEVALTQLIGYDLGRWEESPPGPSGGRPTKTFVLCTTPDETDETPDPDDPDNGGTPPDETPDRPTKPPAEPGAACDESPGNARETDESPVGDGEVSSVSSCVVQGEGERRTAPSTEDTLAEGFVGQDGVSSGYTLITDADGVAHVAAVVEDWGQAVGLDVETVNLGGKKSQPDPRRDKVRLIQVAVGADVFVIDVFKLADPVADLARLFEALGQVEVVAHNAAFELRMLAPLGFVPGRVFCTQLASQVLHAGERTKTGGRLVHKLGEVAERELGRTVDKALQASDWSGRLTPEQLRYAATDAEVMPPLAEALRVKLAAADLTATADLEMRALPGIAWAVPVTVDADQWNALAASAEAERDRLAKAMDAAAPNKGNLTATWDWGKTGQVKAAFKAVGLTVTATDDDTLATIDHPLAGLLRDYRSAAVAAGTYGRKWLAKHAQGGSVMPSWRQIGADDKAVDTGRMSCTDPNLQQIKRESGYRRCFTARPGLVLVKADYSQVELRIAAKVSGDPVMLTAYAEGRDLHVMTAAAVLGKPAERVTKADRQLAKAVNFGLLFGMGARSFRSYALSDYGVALTEGQAREYRDTFFRQYPGLAKWQSRVDREVRQLFRQGASRLLRTYTLGGRRRYVTAGKKKATGDSYPNKYDALNSPVQGTGADGLKAAIALLWERRAECPGAVPVIFCHDEIVVEAPEAMAPQAADWLRRCMVDGMAPLIDPVPVEVDVSVGRTWGGD